MACYDSHCNSIINLKLKVMATCLHELKLLQSDQNRDVSIDS